MSTLTKTKVEVVDTFFKEVWTNENTDMIKQLFVPDDDGDQHMAGGLRKEEKLSPEDFVGFQQALLAQVKNMVITIDQSIEDGDWLAIRCTVNAVGRESGKPVQMKGSGWCRITDGKIREAHNYFDFLHFFEGLHLLPENTLQSCLTGNRAEW